MQKAIRLTRGRYARVDDDTYVFLKQWRWMCSAHGYAIRAYKDDRDRWRFIQMHRIIMDAQPGQLVDHIDGDRLNNVRANLRIVTPSQNAWNSARRCDNSTGYKGVTAHPNGYLARIRYEGQRIHLGYFERVIDAALLYDLAADYLFGDYARLNDPPHPTPAHVREQFDRVLARWAPRLAQSHPIQKSS